MVIHRRSAVPGQVVRTLAPPPEPTVEGDVHHRAGRALAALHFLAAFTVIGSLEHVAAGVRLGIPVKVANGLRALNAGRGALDRLQTA